MKKKSILITGSTDGIGRATARILAQRGNVVYIHGKDREKCDKTCQQLKQTTGNKQIAFFCHDLSSQKEVRAFAAEVDSNGGGIDVLIHNAGVFMNHLELTEDGLEKTFAINHMAPFLLTHLLLEFLQKQASPRIVVVSSIAHRSAHIDFDNLSGRKYFDGYTAYAVSKLANLLFTYALERRLQGTNITVNALHPGTINTKLLHAGFGPGGRSPEEGAQLPVYLALAPELEGVSGKYFENGNETKSSTISYDVDCQEKLWAMSHASLYAPQN